MRTAATVAASIIAIGLYLGVASTFAFSPTWIGLGMLAIALVASIGLVVADQPTVSPVRSS